MRFRQRHGNYGGAGCDVPSENPSADHERRRGVRSPKEDPVRRSGFTEEQIAGVLKG